MPTGPDPNSPGPAIGHRVCIFIPSFGDGGVERMLVNAARGMAEQGAEVDFIVRHAGAPYLEWLPRGVNVLEFGDAGRRELTRRLERHLGERRPRAVVSAKGLDDNIALAAKGAAPAGTRFFLRPGTAVSARLDNRRTHPLRRWWKLRRMRHLYARADGVIAVSHGVAEEIRQATGIDADRIRVVRNPNITPELETLAREPVEHPWLGEDQPPLLVAMGGLRRQKDFPTLIRAFAHLRAERPARLLILGRGRQEDRLRELAQRLGVGEDVELGGFAANPYPYLARASLFVLSSLWEGSPNVLTEALALGTPAVATDCRSGPREILQQGRFGPLVPVGDAPALAEAMARTLDDPLPAATLRSATEAYTMERSARRYLEVLGVEASPPVAGEDRP